MKNKSLGEPATQRVNNEGRIGKQDTGEKKQQHLNAMTLLLFSCVFEKTKNKAWRNPTGNMGEQSMARTVAPTRYNRSQDGHRAHGISA